MIYALERLTSPEIEPVTLAEMKEHLREYSNLTTNDDYITALMLAAREWIENYTGRVLVEQRWRLTLQGEIASPILLRRSPVLSIVSFTEYDDTDAEVAVDSDAYQLRDGGTRWPRIVMLNDTSWTDGDLRIEFRAGFAQRTASPIQGAEAIPDTIKHALKLIVSNYYENREPVNVGNIVNKLPMSIEWLLAGQMSDLGMA